MTILNQAVLDVLEERDVAQAVECPPVPVSIMLSIRYSGLICSLGYFPFQLVVPKLSIKELWYVLSCLCESAYKGPFAAYRKK